MVGASLLSTAPKKYSGPVIPVETDRNPRLPFPVT